MNPANAVPDGGATAGVRSEARSPEPRTPSRSDHLQDYARARLREQKFHQIETGAWPKSAINRPYPTPCNVVVDNRSGGRWDCLTQNQRKILEAFLTYGQKQGDHARLLEASTGDIQRMTGLTRDQVRGGLAGMRQNHTLRLLTPRTRGEHGPENRKKSRWLHPSYADILASRKNDPNVAKDARGYTWANGYSRSRKLLTPAEFEDWDIGNVFPDRPAAATAQQQSKPAADSQTTAHPPAESRAAKDPVGESSPDAAQLEAELKPKAQESKPEAPKRAVTASAEPSVAQRVFRQGSSSPDAMTWNARQIAGLEQRPVSYPIDTWERIEEVFRDEMLADNPHLSEADITRAELHLYLRKKQPIADDDAYTDLEMYVLCLTSGDTRYNQVIEAARSVAAERAETISDEEIIEILRTMEARSAKQKGRTDLHTAAYYLKDIGNNVRIFLKRRKTEKERAQAKPRSEDDPEALRKQIRDIFLDDIGHLKTWAEMHHRAIAEEVKTELRSEGKIP